MNTQQILPMDLNSITQLLDLNGGSYQPFSYKIQNQTSQLSEMIIDTSHCEPDSIQVQIQNNHIKVSAVSMVSVMLDGKETRLSQPISSSFPVPEGVNASEIYTSIDEGSLTMYIPLPVQLQQ
jgi:Hsp20/alpha crystallin family.